MKNQLKELSFSFDWNRVKIPNTKPKTVNQYKTKISLFLYKGTFDLSRVVLSLDSTFVSPTLSQRHRRTKRSKPQDF